MKREAHSQHDPARVIPASNEQDAEGQAVPAARSLDDFDFARPREIARLERRASWLDRHGERTVFAAALLVFLAVGTFSAGAAWTERVEASIVVVMGLLSFGLSGLYHHRGMLRWQIRNLRGEHESLTENKAPPRSQRKSRHRRNKK